MLPTLVDDTAADRATWQVGLAIGLFTSIALAGCAGAPSPDAARYTQMTERDTQLADAAVQRALESSASGVVVVWNNPLNGHRGSVTPVRSYRSRSGHFCREYEERLSIGERISRYRDKACRADAGDWRLVPEATN